MKRYFHIAWMMIVSLVVLTACKDDDNTEDAEITAYRLEQDALFQAKAKDPDFVKWMSEDGNGYVFAKLIKKGDGQRTYYNSHVSVYYKGWLTDGTSFDQKLFEDGEPFTCALSSSFATSAYGSVILGWGVALQRMVEGDKYEVWIPQNLAYGAAGSGSKIKGYSTLIFEIELVSVDVVAAPSK